MRSDVREMQSFCYASPKASLSIQEKKAKKKRIKNSDPGHAFGLGAATAAEAKARVPYTSMQRGEREPCTKFALGKGKDRYCILCRTRFAIKNAQFCSLRIFLAVRSLLQYDTIMDSSGNNKEHTERSPQVENELSTWCDSVF